MRSCNVKKYLYMENDSTVLREKIIEIVNEIYSTMIFMDVEYMDDSRVYQTLSTGISSIVGLGGDVRGVVSVHMETGAALKTTENLLGIALEEIDDDVKDAIGELVNMIAGGVKIFFSDNGIDAKLAIPSTIAGKGYRTGGITGATSVKVPFSIEGGSFMVELRYVLHAKTD